MKTTEDFTRYCLIEWHNYSSQFIPILLKIRETSLKPISDTFLPGYIAADMAYLAANMIIRGNY